MGRSELIDADHSGVLLGELKESLAAHASKSKNRDIIFFGHRLERHLCL
jgi:hypothetical protein